MSEPQRIFLTGAGGFIGSRLAVRLLDRGCALTCLARKPEKLAALAARGAQVVRGDVASSIRMAETVPGHESVFHLAAWYQFGIRGAERRRMEEINVAGTRNVLEAAWRAGAKRILHTSSIVALGGSGPAGQTADESRPHDGRFPSHYARTKHLAHLAAQEMARRGAPVIIVLPGAVYGPGDESALARQLRCIAAGRARAIPAAAGVFPYTHVDDVVEGMLLAWEKGRPGESYLLAGENLSLEEFYQQAARAAGVKPPRWRLPRELTRFLSWWYDFLPGGELLTGGLPMSREAVAMVLDANWAYSSAKAQKELGWRARSFQEGLADTLAALRSAFLG